MPRRGGSGGFGSGRTASPAARPAPQAARPAPPQQKPAQPAPPQQAQSSGGMFSGFGSTLMQGMAFGAGSEVAHQAVRSVIGGGSGHQQVQEQQQVQQQAQQQPQQAYCQYEMDNFSTCLKNQNDITFCQSYMDAMKECQKKYNP